MLTSNRLTPPQKPIPTQLKIRPTDQNVHASNPSNRSSPLTPYSRPMCTSDTSKIHRYGLRLCARLSINTTRRIQTTRLQRTAFGLPRLSTSHQHDVVAVVDAKHNARIDFHFRTTAYKSCKAQLRRQSAIQTTKKKKTFTSNPTTYLLRHTESARCHNIEPYQPVSDEK